MEKIDHPDHYGGDTTYEAIKVIEAWGLNFCLGNVVKYISRCGKKPGSDPIDDLRKARVYLVRESEKKYSADLDVALEFLDAEIQRREKEAA